MPKKEIKKKKKNEKKIEKKNKKHTDNKKKDKIDDTDSEDEIEEKFNIISCCNCKKNIDLENAVIYDYCEDCNREFNQNKINNFISLFVAIDDQFRQLYNENNLLKEKIKIYETNK